ncbi:MAG TPA: hypothetical protein ENJ43_03290 [Gammaproteobacteria bacterium]|nr:hypothetical protein [Gammaproteobacteria bacterium]
MSRSVAFPATAPQRGSRTEPESGAHPHLRVGLLLNSLEQPRWVHELIRGLQELAAIRMAVVFLGSIPGSGSGEKDRGWSRLAYRLYDRFDRWKFLEAPDLLQSGDVSKLIQEWPVQELELLSKPGGAGFSEEASRQVLERQLDVLLFAGDKGFWGEIPRLAKYGLWAFRFGSSQPAAFWEVVEGIPVVPSGLYICSDQEGAERQIYGSVAPSDAHSPSLAANHLHGKTALFAVRKLEQLHAIGEEALDPARCLLPEPVPVPRGSGIPDNLTVTRAFSRLMARFVKDVYHYRVDRKVRWDLAFRFGGDRLDRDELQVITPPEDRFWADPFPWQWGDRYYIFFEELLYSEEKGRLRAMEVRRDGSSGEPVTVLERDYHLSYPFLFRWQGELYMLPETMANRTIELYRCVSFPNRWELCKVLMEGVKAVDATLLERGGRWWMFVSLGLESVDAWDEVSLFHADTPLGPWHPHPCNPVRSDVRAARPAGALFEHRGRLYRPAQDCSVCYGHALSINEIRHLDRDSYEEVEVMRIQPRPELGELGIHTVNQAGDLVVFDRYASEAKSGRLP